MRLPGDNQILAFRNIKLHSLLRAPQLESVNVLLQEVIVVLRIDLVIEKDIKSVNRLAGECQQHHPHNR